MGILMLAMLGLLGLRDILPHERAQELRRRRHQPDGGRAVFVARTGPLAAGAGLMAGSVAGGYAAARGSRRVNPKWVRAFVVVIGVVMGTFTLVKAL